MLLFNEPAGSWRPRRAALFSPARIVLAKGSIATPERLRFVESICAVYPDAAIQRQLDTPHNRIRLDERDPLATHLLGKRTLVFGEHKSAVRRSEEEANACPNYWHFSPYGFCPYGCDYCYLAGTQGVWFSPTVKIYVNLPEILNQIDRIASRFDEPTPFYLGKLQDGLALDGLTGYSRQIVPFFARHQRARLVVLTKSTEIDNLLGLEHGGNTILSWTVNAPKVARAFERNTPDVQTRIEAMCRCVEAGYPVRAVLMPIIPVLGWQGMYADFLGEVLRRVPLARITLGSICSYPQALRLTDLKLGRDNVISASLDHSNGKSADGRLRFPRVVRRQAYGFLIDAIRRIRPDLEIGLCLEDRAMFEDLRIAPSIGKCNCVW
jgi:spore photoproduct lyase